VGGKGAQRHSQRTADGGYFDPEQFIHSNKKAALSGF
jgi:hypothetical protein